MSDDVPSVVETYLQLTSLRRFRTSYVSIDDRTVKLRPGKALVVGPVAQDALVVADPRVVVERARFVDGRCVDQA